jgi:hypothetical protein
MAGFLFLKGPQDGLSEAKPIKYRARLEEMGFVAMRLNPSYANCGRAPPR